MAAVSQMLLLPRGILAARGREQKKEWRDANYRLLGSLLLVSACCLNGISLPVLARTQLPVPINTNIQRKSTQTCVCVCMCKHTEKKPINPHQGHPTLILSQYKTHPGHTTSSSYLLSSAFTMCLHMCMLGSDACLGA